MIRHGYGTVTCKLSPKRPQKEAFRFGAWDCRCDNTTLVFAVEISTGKFGMADTAPVFV